MSGKLLVVLSVGFLLSPCTGLASVINFDDIDTDLNATLVNGYQGLDWSNFSAQPGSGLPGTGYMAGVVSAPNDAFNEAGDPASFSSVTPFSFVSGYFTAAWKEGLNISIQGLNGTNVLFSRTIIVSSTAPTLETFNWTGLTEVTFDSFGGTPSPNPTGTGSQFVLDNLTINSSVPEPGTPLLFAGGLGALFLLKAFTGCARRSGTSQTRP